MVHKILLVDDDADIRTIAELSLRSVGGFDVALVASGREAISAAAEHAPDVVLLDVMMPGMDGPATLSALRNDERTKKLPVIFMTAKVQRHEVQRYLELGALGVIQKPFDPIQLPEEVKRIMAGR